MFQVSGGSWWGWNPLISSDLIWIYALTAIRDLWSSVHKLCIILYNHSCNLIILLKYFYLLKWHEYSVLWLVDLWLVITWPQDFHASCVHTLPIHYIFAMTLCMNRPWSLIKSETLTKVDNEWKVGKTHNFHHKHIFLMLQSENWWVSTFDPF